MSGLRLIRCGDDPRADWLLERLSLPPGSTVCPVERWTPPISPERLLFLLTVDELGPGEACIRLLRQLRALPETALSGCLAGVVVLGRTELDTKDLGRRLIFTLNLAGCGFPGGPLAEATGSMRNLAVTKRNQGFSTLEEACVFAAQGLIDRLAAFIAPRYEKPRLLVLHASERSTSNTLALGDLVLAALDPRFQVRTLSLRNGTIEDCRGCGYQICSHFASRGACFYGGSISQEVLPAVQDCEALLLLLPNYNDSVGANVMAFINRLTSLHVSKSIQGQRLYALVVSGYSGGDLVAQQALGALCLNKRFLLPPGFCLMATANDPGQALTLPGIREQAAAFAARMGAELLE